MMYRILASTVRSSARGIAAGKAARSSMGAAATDRGRARQAKVRVRTGSATWVDNLIGYVIVLAVVVGFVAYTISAIRH